jgi:hypothetical protein
MNAPTGGRPEDRARADIDRLLTGAGILDRIEFGRFEFRSRHWQSSDASSISSKHRWQDCTPSNQNSPAPKPAPPASALLQRIRSTRKPATRLKKQENLWPQMNADERR